MIQLLGRAASVIATTCGIAFAGAAPPPATAGAAAEHITRYDVVVDVARSGRIRVVETIDYVFAGAPRHGIFRTIPVRFRHDGEHDRVYPISHVRVTGSSGTPTQTKVETEGGSKVIRIGDPDRTITGAHRYVIAYDVDGALNRFEGHDELYWNAIGTEWDAAIQRVSVTVRADAALGEIACFAGPEGSRLPCASARTSGTTSTFTHTGLSPLHGLTVVVALPAGYAAAPGPILDERWSLDRAFTRTPATLGLAGLLLAVGLGAVGTLASRRGRDRRWAGEVPGLDPPPGSAAREDLAPVFGDRSGPVLYAPPEGMRPALMGVLLDESADPLDVTATIVDLAVRKYLRIDELPRSGFFRRRDWRLTYLGGPAEGLAGWESKLLAALFESGPEIDVSDLKNKFHTHLTAITAELYDDVVRQGWFTRRPDKQRGWWFTAGVLATAAGGGVTYALARWTHLGLLGIPLVLTGLVLMAVHRRMPFRTAKGSAALARALGFKRYISTAEANQLRFEEGEGIFARYLPYAVVMGETERWAKAFRDLGADPDRDMYWYRGPSGWSSDDFTDSLGAFSTSTSGTLASTPGSRGGSGFGGGSSGGGGGGGGGGSW